MRPEVIARKGGEEEKGKIGIVSADELSLVFSIKYSNKYESGALLCSKLIGNHLEKINIKPKTM
jgi:hypothetical protein